MTEPRDDHGKNDVVSRLFLAAGALIVAVMSVAWAWGFLTRGDYLPAAYFFFLAAFLLVLLVLDVTDKKVTDYKSVVLAAALLPSALGIYLIQQGVIRLLGDGRSDVAGGILRFVFAGIALLSGVGILYGNLVRKGRRRPGTRDNNRGGEP